MQWPGRAVGWDKTFWVDKDLKSLLDWLLLTKRPQNIAKMLPANWGDGWPNVWLGTTTENQQEANRRIPHLQAIPAVVRFLSAEPLLEPIIPALNGIGWVIREQCVKAGVKFFMKQMSRPKKNAIPADLMVRQWPAYNLGLSTAG